MTLLKISSFLWWFVSFTSLSVPPVYLHLCFLAFSHPHSLFHPVIPGLVVCHSVRLRGTVDERAVGRLCGHRSGCFPQAASNAAEPWPQRVLTPKICVERDSAGQTLFRTGLSIRREKNLTHFNCSDCPLFVCWSSRVGHWPPLARTKLPKSLFSMWFDPQDQTLGIFRHSSPWRFAPFEIYPSFNSKWLMIFFSLSPSVVMESTGWNRQCCSCFRLDRAV